MNTFCERVNRKIRRGQPDEAPKARQPGWFINILTVSYLGANRKTTVGTRYETISTSCIGDVVTSALIHTITGDETAAARHCSVILIGE